MSASPCLRDPQDVPRVIAETRAWVDRVVIGLNLCPFAKSVQVKGQVRYVMSAATTPEALRSDLEAELRHLAAVDPAITDTTLLIHPQVLQDFSDFNDFLDQADEALDLLDLLGVLQVASFHPRYQFAGTREDDLDNATNRSPWPTLHLIREASMDRAVAAFPEAETIFETNINTLRQLGAKGWATLQRQCQEDALNPQAGDDAPPVDAPDQR